MTRPFTRLGLPLGAALIAAAAALVPAAHAEDAMKPPAEGAMKSDAMAPDAGQPAGAMAPAGAMKRDAAKAAGGSMKADDAMKADAMAPDAMKADAMAAGARTPPHPKPKK